MIDTAKNLKDSVKDNVLKRLEREGITPRSRWYWLTYEYSLWVAWLFSVLLGAVALAVLSFTSVYMGYALYEATHGGFVTFFFDTLPYLWLVAFAGLTLIAHFNLRNTKRGYKYPFYLVVASSFGFSVAGAIALYQFGAGYYLDRFLGEQLPGYQSRAEFEALLWQNPLSGRLLGAVEEPGKARIPLVMFRDVRSEVWVVTTTELRDKDTELLLSGQKVRLLVATTTPNLHDGFVACAVFPWELDKAPALVKLRDNRKEFLENIKERRVRVEEIVKEVIEGGDGEGKDLVATSSPENVVAKAANSPCNKHPMFTKK